MLFFIRNSVIVISQISRVFRHVDLLFCCFLEFGKWKWKELIKNKWQLMEDCELPGWLQFLIFDSFLKVLGS